MTALQAEAIRRFNELRLQAHEILAQASTLALPPVQMAQLKAASFFCGVKLHTIHGQATADDAVAVQVDLQHIAKLAVDPLVEAIGREARSNFNGIDETLFAEQLFGAIDGNALHCLEEAAEDLKSSRDDTMADHRRSLVAAE
jgi:hypothetical protein